MRLSPKTISILMSSLFVALLFLSSPVQDVVAQTRLVDPLGLDIQDPEEATQVIIGNVIQAILGIIGSVTLIVMIYGGVLWLTSAGNQERITKGKNVLIWGTIGLVFVFGSYSLVNQIFKAVPSGGLGDDTEIASDAQCEQLVGECITLNESNTGIATCDEEENIDRCVEAFRFGEAFREFAFAHEEGVTRAQFEQNPQLYVGVYEVREELCSGTNRVCAYKRPSGQFLEAVEQASFNDQCEFMGPDQECQPCGSGFGYCDGNDRCVEGTPSFFDCPFWPQ